MTVYLNKGKTGYYNPKKYIDLDLRPQSIYVLPVNIFLIESTAYKGFICIVIVLLLNITHLSTWVIIIITGALF